MRQQALEFAGVGLYRYRFDGTVLFMDRGALRILDLERAYPDPESVAGRNIADLLCYVRPPGALREEVRRHGHIRNVEYPLRTLTGHDRWVLHDSYLVRDSKTDEEQIQVIIYDITQRKEMEDRLRALNRALAMLSAVNEALIRAAEEDALLGEVCRIVVEVGGYRMAWVGFAETDAAKSVRAAASAGDDQGYLQAIRVSWADDEMGKGPTGTAVRTGKLCVAHDFQADTALGPWRAEAGRRGYASSIALPLAAEGHVIGALTIYAGSPGAFEPLDAESVRLLTELANDLAHGILALRARRERESLLRALDAERRLLQSAVDHAPAGIALLRAPDLVFDVVNPRYQAFAPGKQMLGRRHADVWPEISGQVLPLIERALRTGEPFSASDMPFRIRRAEEGDVEDAYFTFAFVPVRQSEGPAGGLLILAMETTEQVLARRRIEDAQRQVLQAQMEKQRFYRDVIRGVTRDKLHLVDAAEIPLAGELVMRIPVADMAGYHKLRERLQRVARRAGMDKAAENDLVLAASEAAMNGIRHGVDVRCAAYVSSEYVAVRVTDHGPGIAPENLAGALFVPGFSTAVSLGMGYTLMLQLVDRVWLATGPDGTLIQLAKRIHPEQPAAEMPAAWAQL